MKIRMHDAFALFCIMATVFQSLLINIWSGFSYIDECLAIFCLFYCVIYFASNRKCISRSDNQILLTLIGILCIGIAGNFYSGVQNNWKIMVIDILATYKNFIVYFAFKWGYTKQNSNAKVIHTAARIFELYVVVCAFFAILNQFADINMSSGYDFGLKNFSFIFLGSGNYAMAFYVIAFAICLDSVLREGYNTKNKVNIFIMMFAWGASLTTRSLAYIAMYILMMFISKYFTKNRIKFWHILIVGTVAALIGYSTIAYYFMNEHLTARGVLLQYSFVVAKRFFPLGAGFAAYGSNMAAEYYSSLYYQFGFDKVWGLSVLDPSFANDSFWPEILGQFGFAGMILCCITLVIWYKKILKLNISKHEKIVLQWIFFVMLAGSSGTKTYIHAGLMGIYIIFALYENYLTNRVVVSGLAQE